MINESIVKIIANRIVNSGINPKTGEIYVIDDLTNEDYKNAVRNCIQEITKAPNNQ